MEDILQGRIVQGKEPPQFIALFQPMVILKVLFVDLTITGLIHQNFKMHTNNILARGRETVD